MLIRLTRDVAFDEALEGVEDCFFFLLGVEEDFDVLDCIIATFTLGVMVSFCFCSAVSLRLSARAARRDIVGL